MRSADKKPASGENGTDSTALLRQVMRLAHVAYWEARATNLDLLALRGGETTGLPFRFSRDQTAPGTCWCDNVYSPDQAQLRAFLKDSRTGESLDYRVIVGEGELWWLRHFALPPLGGNGSRRRLRGLLMAIPEQKQLEGECLRASERECTRIGQHLHDDLCQVLVGLQVGMKMMEQRARTVDPTFAADVADLCEQIGDATERVRAMARGLFPAHIRYTTLRHALCGLVAEVRARFRVEVTLSIAARVPRHTADQIAHIYRIAQEAVSNALRHGRATAIRIAVVARGGTVTLTIEDNGAGFPAGATRSEGIGIPVMGYRARAVGGVLQFKRTNSRGVVVQLVYPVVAPAARQGRPQNPLS